MINVAAENILIIVAVERNKLTLGKSQFQTRFSLRTAICVQANIHSAEVS